MKHEQKINDTDFEESHRPRARLLDYYEQETLSGLRSEVTAVHHQADMLTERMEGIYWSCFENEDSAGARALRAVPLNELMYDFRCDLIGLRVALVSLQTRMDAFCHG